MLDLTHDLLKLDSSIFQMDVQENFLLVSTLTRSYICNTKLETFAQVGVKSRQGEYGGCFCQITAQRKLTSIENSQSFESSEQSELFETETQFVDVERASEALSDAPLSPQIGSRTAQDFTAVHDSFFTSSFDEADRNGLTGYSSKHELRAFCSRPGSRIWECDCNGKVIATHQLRKALSIPPAPVIILNDTNTTSIKSFLDSNSEYRKKDNSDFSYFKKILRFYDEYLITYSTHGIYIVDPNNSKILLRTPILEGVKDIKIKGSTTLIFTPGGALHKLQVVTIDVAILALHANALYERCADICLKYSSIFHTSYLLKRFWKGIVHDLLYHVEDPSLMRGIDDLKKEMMSLASNQQSSSNLWIKNDKILSLPSQLIIGSHNNQAPSFKDIEMDSEKDLISSSDKLPSDTSTLSSSESHKSDWEKQCLDNKSTFKASQMLWNVSKSKTTELLNQTNFEMISGVHDVVGNLASNLVSTITSSTKSIRSTLASQSPVLQKTGHYILQSLDGGSVINGEELSSLESSCAELFHERKDTITRDEPVVIQARIKKSKRERASRKIGSLEQNKMSNFVTPSLPCFVKLFQKDASDITNLLLVKESQTCVAEILKQWLKKYLDVNDRMFKYKTEQDEIRYQQLTSSTQFREMVKNTSFLFLNCFQHHILLVNDDDHSNEEIVSCNEMRQQDVDALDHFYADMIRKDENLLDYGFLMNKFYSLEQHLLTHSWISLLNKLTDSGEERYSAPPQVLPDVEFTRAQRIQYLRSLAESGNRKDFISGASCLRNPSVLFDVYYLCKFIQCDEAKFVFKDELHDSLNSYLCQVSLHDEIVLLYAQNWSACPEMQFEILSSLLYRCTDVEHSCDCGMPRPNAFVSGPTLAFLRAILRFPIYQPRRVLKLLEEKRFYTGIFELVCRYNLKAIQDIVPSILQSFHRPSIDALFNLIRPDQYFSVLRALATIRGRNDCTIRCQKCSRPLPTRPDEALERRFANVFPRVEDEGSLQVWSDGEPLAHYSSLWQIVVTNMLSRVGGEKLLTLFQDMIGQLPQVALLKRLVESCFFMVPQMDSSTPLNGLYGAFTVVCVLF